MPVFKNTRDEYILFIHIPKSAGTSVNSVIEASTALYGVSLSKGQLPAAPQHFHAQLLKQIGYADLAQGSFAITREPLTRLISEYRYRCKNSRLIARLFDFETFALFAIGAYRKNSFILDNHIRPQSEFVLPDTKTYKIEDGLDKAMNDIAQTFGLKLTSPVKHKNRSPQTEIRLSEYGFDALVRFYEQDYLRFDYQAPRIQPYSASFLSFFWVKTKVRFMLFLYSLRKMLPD